MSVQNPLQNPLNGIDGIILNLNNSLATLGKGPVQIEGDDPTEKIGNLRKFLLPKISKTVRSKEDSFYKVAEDQRRKLRTQMLSSSSVPGLSKNTISTTTKKVKKENEFKLDSMDVVCNSIGTVRKEMQNKITGLNALIERLSVKNYSKQPNNHKGKEPVKKMEIEQRVKAIPVTTTSSASSSSSSSSSVYSTSISNDQRNKFNQNSFNQSRFKLLCQEVNDRVFKTKWALEDKVILSNELDQDIDKVVACLNTKIEELLGKGNLKGYISGQVLDLGIDSVEKRYCVENARKLQWQLEALKNRL